MYLHVDIMTGIKNNKIMDLLILQEKRGSTLNPLTSFPSKRNIHASHESLAVHCIVNRQGKTFIAVVRIRLILEEKLNKYMNL